MQKEHWCKKTILKTYSWSTCSFFINFQRSWNLNNFRNTAPMFFEHDFFQNDEFLHRSMNSNDATIGDSQRSIILMKNGLMKDEMRLIEETL